MGVNEIGRNDVQGAVAAYLTAVRAGESEARLEALLHILYRLQDDPEPLRAALAAARAEAFSAEARI